MFRELSEMLFYSALGFGFGTLLAVMGFLAAGFGHGTYVIIGLSSAPCSLAQDLLLALIAPPFLWAILTFFAAGARHRVWQMLFLTSLGSHYASLFWVWNNPSGFADWRYVHKAAELVWAAIGVYGLGQIALWSLFVYKIWRQCDHVQEIK
jgi:hypothetical protein